MKLSKLGWNKSFEKNFENLKGLKQGRVVKESRRIYQVYCEDGLRQVEVSGRFHYTVTCKSDYPVVGDWVALKMQDGRALIEEMLPRRTAFSRKVAGKGTEEQVVASNIDMLGIVCGLDGGRNFNLRGIERYLVMAREGGVQPIIVLNKVDLCTHPQAALHQTRSISGKIPVFLVSALQGDGIRNLAMSFAAGSTIAFVGPSGVGKSALLNALLGKEAQITGLQRETDLRGRHTTTHKELFFLEGGAMVIDTPGMRELQPWGTKEGLAGIFGEIEEAEGNCRFRDCSHQGEPGCAVQQLLVDGALDFECYQNYLDMRTELTCLESRLSEKGRLERKKKKKQLSQKIKNVNNVRYREHSWRSS